MYTNIHRLSIEIPDVEKYSLRTRWRREFMNQAAILYVKDLQT